MMATDLSKFLNDLDLKGLHVLDKSIPRTKYIPLDLSETNAALNNIDVSSVVKLGGFIDDYMHKFNANVAYGGYLETRNIYKRSAYFNKQATNERNIHLGVDLWCDSETSIYAPLPGKVHSFKNNTNFGDYGPTILLEHCIDEVVFYTLYGHLSMSSIKNIKVGQVFNQGEKLAVLGDVNVNGNYPPHLHFQIIQDLQGNIGDYPGVCSKQGLNFYSKNCPNPSLILDL